MTPNIFPVMRYRDLPAAISWLTRAFGFEKQVEFAAPDGTIGHAELRLGAGVIGLSSAGPVSNDNPWTTARQGVYVRVDDVDAHHGRACSGGAAVVRPPADTDYGSRKYSARDLDGHLWAFGTYAMGARPGRPNIFPELRYPSGARAISWLRDAFGFETVVEVPGPEGKIVHAEMRFGDGVIMIDPGGEPGGVWGDSGQAMSVQIDDPDAHFQTAIKAGAVVAVPLATTHYGARHYWVRDLEGFLWGFSTYRPAGV